MTRDQETPAKRHVTDVGEVGYGSARRTPLQGVEFILRQAGLTQDASQGSDRQLAVAWHDYGTQALRDSPNELDTTSALACLDEPSRQQLAPDDSVRQWAQAALTSTSMGRTLGVALARGASK